MTSKKILITGADGFIGSHLTEMLVESGNEVTALAMYNSFNDWGWLEEVKCKADINIISGDIRDSDFCRKITKDIEVIYHLAALIGIPYSYQAPHTYVDTNIKGTLNICQSALDNDIEKLIHTSTSEVYGTSQYVPINENPPLQPQSPYSASKISADAMAMSFYNSFDLPLVIARPFNTYGPRQSSRAIIPTIITQIASGSKVINLGDLTPTRDFSFVIDTCNGFKLLGESSNVIGETINIGSNTEISIDELVNKIKYLMGSDVEIKSDNERIRPKNSEVFRLVCDNQKIIKLVSYKPLTDIDSGLRKTIDWVLEPDHLKRYKTEIFNV
ncbi:MAG: SDR family NAD(P)-dependent oxidoreductase [Flavobacteriales bacterium]|nr:SDR family NAD(P)-dependent oxidoreductase [Flavobacteriales bacterium]